MSRIQKNFSKQAFSNNCISNNRAHFDYLYGKNIPFNTQLDTSIRLVCIETWLRHSLEPGFLVLLIFVWDSISHFKVEFVRDEVY